MFRCVWVPRVLHILHWCPCCPRASPRDWYLIVCPCSLWLLHCSTSSKQWDSLLLTWKLARRWCPNKQPQYNLVTWLFNHKEGTWPALVLHAGTGRPISRVKVGARFSPLSAGSGCGICSVSYLFCRERVLWYLLTCCAPQISIIQALRQFCGRISVQMSLRDSHRTGSARRQLQR